MGGSRGVGSGGGGGVAVAVVVVVDRAVGGRVDRKDGYGCGEYYE